MIRAIDIKAELAARPMLRGRSTQTPEAEARAAFAVLAPFRDGSIFAGSFSGETPWERHRNGDELVHVLDGAATLTIMTDGGPQSFTLTAGMVVVVPQGALASVPRPRRRHGAERHSAADRPHRRRGPETVARGMIHKVPHRASPQAYSCSTGARPPYFPHHALRLVDAGTLALA
jgi:uncharacterized cupin superfamily protein